MYYLQTIKRISAKVRHSAHHQEVSVNMYQYGVHDLKVQSHAFVLIAAIDGSAVLRRRLRTLPFCSLGSFLAVHDRIRLDWWWLWKINWNMSYVQTSLSVFTLCTHCRRRDLKGGVSEIVERLWKRCYRPTFAYACLLMFQCFDNFKPGAGDSCFTLCTCCNRREYLQW